MKQQKPCIQNGLAFTWGSTRRERRGAFPCDAYLPQCDHILHRGIDVEASAAIVFRWFCQLKVAPYSYDWIDNFGKQSPPALTEGADRLFIGEQVMTIFELASYQQDRHLTVRMKHPRGRRLFGDIALTYRVVPLSANRSRISIRMRVKYPVTGLWALMRWVLPWCDLVMMRKQVKTLKKLAEGHDVVHSSKEH